MGFLISKLWNRLRGSQECKITMLGLANAGKTTILYKLHLGTLISAHPTIGSNVEEVQHNNIRLQVWDLGGQESMRSCWSTYYPGTHGIIFVVDSTDLSSALIAKMELFNLLMHPDLKSVPILVFANKQDLDGAMSYNQFSECLSLSEVRDHEWQIQECSAATGQGLYNGLDWLTSKISDR